MSNRAFILIFLGIALFLPLLASGQQVVEVGGIQGWGDWCGTEYIASGVQLQYMIKLTNVSGTGCAYDPSLSFVISSPDGGTWENLGIYPLPSVSSAFDQFLPWYGNFTGAVADTFGVNMVAGTQSGLFDGYDDLTLYITFSVPMSANGSSICLDTASYGAGFDWSWTGLAGCADILPDWEGPYCYEVWSFPDMPPVVVDAPGSINATYCEPTSYQILASFTDPGHGEESAAIEYSIAEGPGDINSSSGLWTWDGVTDADPSGSDILKIVVTSTICSFVDTAEIVLNIDYSNNQAPYFSFGCRSTIAAWGGPGSVTLTAQDDCSPDLVTAELLSMDGTGTVEINGTTISYTPGPGEQAIVPVRVAANDGIVQASEWCEIRFDAWDCGDCQCCGYYTSGYTGDVDRDGAGKYSLSDITRLIDFVYISKAPLICPAEGNCDGDPEGRINLADITRLIGFVYIYKQLDALATCQ